MKMTLGNFIAQLRKEKNLTQKQLSEILGVSDKTISHWEREESAPDISILPLLADTLGVTVDELLAGEISTSAEPAPQFIPTPKTDKTANGYRMFKIGNIVSAGLSIFWAIVGIGISFLLSPVMIDYTARRLAFFATLGGVFVSVVLTVIFNVIFTTKLNDTHGRYRFIANRISILNIYLGIICTSVNLAFTGRDSFLYIIIALGLCLILELILKKTSILSIDKAFETERKKSIYLLRKSCAVLCVVLIIIGGSVHYFFGECWHTSETDRIIHSVEDFKKYMETPTPRPEDAFDIDGVEVTTAPPTTSPVPTLDTQSPVATIPSGQFADYAYPETVYDEDGNEIVTFMYENKAVYRYSYHSGQGDFYITTYDSIRKAEKINCFLDGGLDALMMVYYIAVIAVSLIRYKKKSAEI